MSTRTVAPEYQDWIDQVIQILLNCQACLSNLKVVSTPDQAWQRNWLEAAPFHGLRYHYTFILVVELDKLCSSSANQKRSIPRLLDSFDSAAFRSKFDSTLLSNSMHEYPSRLWSSSCDLARGIELLKVEFLKHDDMLKQLTVVRNKIFAHTDPIANPVAIGSLDLLQVFSLCCSTIMTIENKLFDRDTYFDMKDWSLQHLIDSWIGHAENKAAKWSSPSST